jgi:endonuclease YncB( thermonuclease family)
MELELFSFVNLADYVEVISILDGDTVAVAIPIYMQFGSKKCEKSGIYRFNIRLYGIDSCELKSKDPEQSLLAHKAKTRLTELITKCNNKIFVKLLKYDKYGRILGELYNNEDDQVSFNQILLKENLAKSYFGGTK